MNIRKIEFAIVLRQLFNQALSSISRALALGVVGLICLSAISSTSAAKLYKWVDSAGNISYQDQPPPKSAKILEESEIAAASAPASDDQSTNQLTSVTVYTVEACDACELLLVRFRQLGISAQEQSLADPSAQQRILDLGEGLAAPTLFIGDSLVTDLSETNLISELVAAGYGPQNSNISSSDLPEAISESENGENSTIDEDNSDIEDEDANTDILDLIDSANSDS